MVEYIGVIALKMYIYVEKEFSSGLWFTKAVEGVNEIARKHNIKLIFVDYDMLLSNQLVIMPNILVVIGASDANLSNIINFCENNCIKTLLVNYFSPSPTHSTSCVVMDYQDTMERIFSYFQSNGKTKTALIGVNRDSSSDRKKAEFMVNSNFSENIFHNANGVTACIEDFLARKSDFDSVIFTNDVVMFAAAAKFREVGLRMPEDIYAVSFSDTMVAPIFGSPFSPEISTFSINYCELGRQCAELWYYMVKSGADIAATIRVRASFIPNRSTDFKPLNEFVQFDEVKKPSSFNFYSDKVVHEIISLENCLISSDEVDFSILKRLSQGEARSKIAQELFISEGTLYYRLRRLCKLANVDSVADLTDLIRKFV